MHRKRSRSSSGTARSLREREHAPVEFEQRQLAVDRRGDGRAHGVGDGRQRGRSGGIGQRQRRGWWSVPSGVAGDRYGAVTARPSRGRLGRLGGEPHAAALAFRGRAPRGRPRARASSSAVGSDHDQRGVAPPGSSPRRALSPAQVPRPCRWSATPGRASSRDRPRPGAARRAARRAACGARWTRRSARTARPGCCACPGTRRAQAPACRSGRRTASAHSGKLAPLELVVEEPDVERRVVDDPRRAAREIDELGRDVANFGLPFRSSHVMPCTSVAPASMSRSGSKWRCRVRPVGRRSTSSTAANSMMRWPSFGSRPVVSVSMMSWRIRGVQERL